MYLYIILACHLWFENTFWLKRCISTFYAVESRATKLHLSFSAKNCKTLHHCLLYEVYLAGAYLREELSSCQDLHCSASQSIKTHCKYCIWIDLGNFWQASYEFSAVDTMDAEHVFWKMCRGLLCCVLFIKSNVHLALNAHKEKSRSRIEALSMVLFLV